MQRIGGEIRLAMKNVASVTDRVAETGQPVGIVTAYVEAGNLLRHYSSCRLAVVSFLLPICFGMSGLAISKKDELDLMIYLLIGEVFLFTVTLTTSVVFSTMRNEIRKSLVAAEAGKSLNVYNLLDKLNFRKCLINAFRFRYD